MLDRSALEERICTRLGRKPKNLDRYVQVYEIFSVTPDMKGDEAAARIDCPLPTFYRIMRELKNAKLLGEKVFLKGIDIPQAIQMGQLPPVRYSVTHLAAYLNKFKDNETVPPYNKTKKEIVQLFRKKMMEDAELGQDIIWGIQERFAYLAFLSGDLTQFSNMLGTVTPPNELEKEYVEA